jgi:Rrf2 family nitric oxide-sensitive transcriptional repressor
MRLTRFTDNALRCLMYLGRNPDRVVTVGEVSRRMGMSEDHLLKVVKRLVDLGHVRTLRGRAGGLKLNRPASEIVVADVVRATEDNLAIVPCLQPGDESCPLRDNCDLAGTFEEALGAFFGVLQRKTLEDLLGAERRAQSAKGGITPVDAGQAV